MHHTEHPLQSGEELMAKVHETPLVHAWRFCLLGLWILLPFFFLFPLLSHGVWGAVIFLLIASSGAFLLCYVYHQWKGTYLLITDRRIIDVEQKGWSKTEVYEIFHTQVKDVEVKRHGLWAHVLGYGDIEIDIVHGSENLRFLHVRHPKRTQYLLLDLRDLAQGLLT
jgi:hypothetical protein